MSIRYSLCPIRYLCPERQEFRQRFAVMGDLPTLAFKIVGNGAAEAWIGDPVGGVGGRRPVAAGKLVLALGAGFDARKAVRDRPVDRLVIAELEMQKRLLIDRPPIAAIERV